MMVTIPIEEYEELKKDRDLLCALQAGGVESWEGYRYACLLKRRGTDDTSE